MSDVKATKTQLDKLSRDPEVKQFIAIKQKSDIKDTHADRKLKMEIGELITKAREIAKRKGMDDTLARMTELETKLNIGHIKPREMRHLKQRLQKAVATQNVVDAGKGPEEMEPMTEGLNVTDGVGFLSTDVKPLFDSFVQFSQKNIGFNRPPTINFMHDEQNAGNVLGKTACYQPDKEAITIFTTGRHPKDVLRSLSHEMVHHFQNCEGRLQNITTGEGYTQKDSNMRELEREAYESGNMNFRDWEDNYKQGLKQMNENDKELIDEGLKDFVDKLRGKARGRDLDWEEEDLADKSGDALDWHDVLGAAAKNMRIIISSGLGYKPEIKQLVAAFKQAKASHDEEALSAVAQKSQQIVTQLNEGETKMSLNEWMNQERNVLLREKFGIPLKEEVDNKVDFKEKATAESDGTDMVAEDEELDKTCALPQEPEETEDEDDEHDVVYEEKTRTLVAELVEKALQKIQSE